jgi:hypothetical protein
MLEPRMGRQLAMWPNPRLELLTPAADQLPRRRSVSVSVTAFAFLPMIDTII